MTQADGQSKIQLKPRRIKMKWFFNMKTAVKLISAFAIVAIILAFVGYNGLLSMGKINSETTNMYANNLTPINDLSSAEILYQRIRVNIRDMNSLASATSEKDQYKEKIKGLSQEIGSKMDKYSQTQLTAEEREQLKKFAPAWQAYNKLMDEAMQMNYEGKNSGEFSDFLRGGFKQAGDQLQTVLDDLIALNVKLAEQTKADSEAVYASSRSVTTAVIIAAVLLSIGLGYIISQIITRPLHRLVRVVGRVAEGDLRETTDIDTKDEIGRLAASVNGMVLSLRATVSGISASAESVSAAAQQISATTEEIAGGSTSQAEAAQTINELFRDLSAATSFVAEGAEQASELSEETKAIARDGGLVVRSSIEGMNAVNQQMSRLEEDSHKIGDIIEVIDDIADQTNLLALNAAIEAARAGDQGRGFAVVAEEVRKLAERSSEATKQITGIIRGMQDNTRQGVLAVADGVALSQKNGEAFEHIIAMVNKSGDKVTEIAGASEQQAAQSSQVLSSIESISAATQEAAASSQETAATAQSLAGLAEDLNNTIASFKVK